MLHQQLYAGRQQDRLEYLLSRAEQAANVRHAYVGRAYLRVLKDFLDHGATYRTEESRGVIGALPDDRLQRIASLFYQTHLYLPGAAKIFQEIKKLPLQQQGEAMWIAERQAGLYCDQATWVLHRQNVARALRAVTREFPELVAAENTKGNDPFADVVHKIAPRMSGDWRWKTVSGREEIVEMLLREAFGDEEVDALSFVSTDKYNGPAAYINDGEVFLFGQGFERDDFGFIAYCAVHEFQHHRQDVLRRNLEAGHLSHGTKAYYQARLYSANQVSYIHHDEIETGRLGRYLALIDYADQPMEANAYSVSRLSMMNCGLMSDRMQEPGKKLVRSFLRAAVHVQDMVATEPVFGRLSRPDTLDHSKI